jgi:hypothetical protein
VEAIIAARGAARFAGVADLAARVDLSAKEIDHLTRCGALDGLGESRAALHHEAGAALRAGSAQQMSFDFLNISVVQAETAADRLSWEMELLGRPLSVHPLELARRRRTDVAIRRLPESRGKKAAVCVVRVPGWPGGTGFFMGDGDDFAIARPDKTLAAARVRWPSWRPMRLSGRWKTDEWGGGWFEVEAYEML